MTVSAAQGTGAETPSLRAELWWVAGLFGLALALRWVAVFRLATIFNDGPTFLRLAAQMGAGEWREALGHPYHPLYPFLIQAIGSVFDDPLNVAVGISLVSGSLCVVAFYAFLRQVWPRSTALTGGLLLAIHPYAIRFSADVQSDSLYMLFFLTSVALLMRELDRPSFIRALFFGVVVSLAYLTRPEGLVVGGVALIMVTLFWLRRSWSGFSSVAAIVGMGAGILLPAIPYALMLKSVTGDWNLTQKKSVLVLLGIMPGESGGSWGFGSLFELGPGWGIVSVVLLVALGGGLAWAVRRSGRLDIVFTSRRLWVGTLVGIIGLALISATTLFDLWLRMFSTLRPEFTLLLVLGIVAGALHTSRPSAGIISLLMLVYGLMLYSLLLQYGYVSRRHLLPPLALLLGYCAVGAHYAADWLSERRWRWTHEKRSRALGLVLALTVAIALPKAWRDYRGEEHAGRLAAEWLRDKKETPGLMASHLSKLSYYAEREWHPLGWDGQRYTFEQLWSNGVRFVISEVDLGQDWSSDPNPSEKFVPVQRHRVHSGDYEAFVLELVVPESSQ